MPPLENDNVHLQGYMGHDEFAVAGDVLLRHFPVYKEGDMNKRPMGGVCELCYRLVRSEVSWVLQVQN